ncbi:MAG: hypothetical protein OEY37_11090, partial [Gammaproteobacteria bacterium]|nr:hypothetical protein [Gammaproteobacteria bacterium]
MIQDGSGIKIIYYIFFYPRGIPGRAFRAGREKITAIVRVNSGGRVEFRGVESRHDLAGGKSAIMP